MDGKIEDLTRTLVRMLRDRVRNREPYEIAFEEVLQSTVVADAHVSKAEELELREELQATYLDVAMREARSTPHEKSSITLKGHHRPRHDYVTAREEQNEENRKDFPPKGPV